jgi:predicted phosphodiesterase
MKTAIISDLHLGVSSGGDVVRDPEIRAVLLEELRGAERLILLGDIVELRERPLGAALDHALLFFAELGAAVGDVEVVLVPGNHDSRLAEPLLDRLSIEDAPLPLDAIDDPTPGPTATIAAALSPARLRIAYPGIWLRDDVYAIHGHYSDVHATVPTFERLAAGSMARYVARLPADGATADDYEAILSPLYAWLHALTQRADHTLIAAGGTTSAGAYAQLTAKDRHKRPRTLAFAVAYRSAVFALNRAGLGPLEPSLTPSALRRGYLTGIKAVIERLDIHAAHVIWGHSHRSGPWPSDDQSEWIAATGARILNTGSWVYQPHFLSPEPNGSPYWPGTAVIVDDAGPPRLVRLLGERGHDVLRPQAPR